MPWQAFGIEDGERVPLDIIDMDEAPSLGSFREELGSSASFDRYFPEIDGRMPGVDALDYWAEAAAYDSDSNGADRGGGLDVWDGDSVALVEDELPRCVAWHHRSSVIVNAPAEYMFIELVYVATPEEEERRDRKRAALAERGGRGGRADSILLEINGIVGDESFGFRDLVRVPKKVVSRSTKVAKSTARVVLKTGRQPVKLLGGAVEVIGSGMYTECDGAFKGRLRHEERRAPDVAAAIPRLGDPGVDVGQQEAVAVLVHGFGSCAVPAARALHGRGFEDRIRTFRFEHDTFKWPRDNARELASLTRQWLPEKRVLFLCHSRGGLVARFAAAKLESHTTRLLTLGTPHAGTPIAATWGTGARFRHQGLILASALYDDETRATGGVPHAGSVARGYFTRRHPPPGLSALRPESEFFRDLDEDAPPGPDLTAYGAEFRAEEAVGAVAKTRGRLATAFTDGIFKGEPNDLVVPTRSALAVPAGYGHRLAESCAHSDYYSDEEALRAIEAAADAIL